MAKILQLELLVEVKVPQVMHCMLCYSKLVSHVVLEHKIKFGKYLFIFQE
jgi:hypothetical protein